ncbi:hypothetical protein HW555_008816, partial [Spodoptera exigua]
MSQPKGPSQGQPKGPSQGQTKSRDASASETSRAPSAASLARGSDIVSDFSDNESILSGTTCGSTRQSRKRAFLRQDSRGSPDQTEKPAKRAVIQADLEERISSNEQRARTTRAKAGYGASSVLYADHSVEEMERMALEDQQEILEVASKSSNLKGTFQKALKCRAASLLGIVKELAQRTTSDETRQLQAKVDRLQKEVSALHARVAELMARPEGTSEGPASMPAPSNLEEIIRKVVMEERAFTRACFAGIEDRLLPEKRLRPPLAADKVSERTPSAPGPSTAPAQRESKGKGKGKGKKTTPAAPTAQTVPQDLPREDPLLPSTTPSNQPWVKVVSKKRKGKKKGARWGRPRAVFESAVYGSPRRVHRGDRGGKDRGLLLNPRSMGIVARFLSHGAGWRVDVRGSRGSSSVRKRPHDPALVGDGSVGLSSDEEGLLAPKLPTARRGRQASKGVTASRPRRDAQGRFLRSNTPAASEAESDMGVTTEDPGGESCASLGSSKAELNATRREQRKAVAADEDLRRQVAALSEQQQRRTSTDAAPVVAPAPAPRPAGARTDDEVERIVRLCLLQCGSMMNARIEAISRRLLRKSSLPMRGGGLRRRRDLRLARRSPRRVPEARGGNSPSDQPTTAGSKGETWATVVGRKKARKAAKAASAAARAPAEPQRRLLSLRGGLPK